jgi:hypothetical protein
LRLRLLHDLGFAGAMAEVELPGVVDPIGAPVRQHRCENGPLLFIGALIPAWRAARLKIVDCLRAV